MLLTEQEAKAKWCPHARIVRVLAENAGGVPVTAATANRMVSNGAPVANCIGSQCMAWRSVEQAWNDRANRWQTADREFGDPEATHRTLGYCGLAGDPR